MQSTDQLLKRLAPIVLDLNLSKEERSDLLFPILKALLDQYDHDYVCEIWNRAMADIVEANNLRKM